MKRRVLKFLFLFILLTLSNSPFLTHAAWIDVETTDYDSSNDDDFNRKECLNDMSGQNIKRLRGRAGYAYQSMTKAQRVRMQYSPSIAYTDYIYQQCRGQKPVSVHRFILTLSDQDPFEPKYTVALDSVEFREGYGIPGYGQTALMFNCDLYEVCLTTDWGALGSTRDCWSDVCEAYGWWDRFSQTFDKTEIRDWNDGNAGYGTKDLMAYRICLRSVPPGQPFNPRDATNITLVPDPDALTTLGVIPPSNTPAEKLASLYARDKQGRWINASNRTKVCAYNVQIKPDCSDPATQTAFAVGASVAGGLLGGPIGAAVVGSFAGQLCSLIAGDGPCFAPQVSWSSAFIGCVDVPIPPGPPILNATLPIVIKAVIDSKVAYPQATPASINGEKAPVEMSANLGKPFQELIDIRTDNSLKIGGTFDQPIVQIVTGAATEDLFPAPAALSADDAQIYNKVKLRYKFPNDTAVIDNLPVCDTISSDYLNARFCAYYDEATPDKICACVQDDISFNDCYDPACTNSDRTTCPLTDQLMGCAVRPTPNRSSIQYSLTQSTVQQSKVKVLENQLGINRPKVDYPSIQLRFKAWREKNTNNRVVKVGGQWFTSKDGWTLTAAVHPVDETNIEQFTLPDVTGGNYNIPEYEFQGQTTSSSGGILENCLIVVDSSGAMRHANYYDGHPWTTACNYTPNISRKFYGLNFQAIVPDYDDQNKVKSTQIITPDQILPTTAVVADDGCHKNYNTCVKSYISSADFQRCWTQDISNLANNGTKSRGMEMKYPVLSLPGQASSRSFNKICDSQKLSKMVQTCGRTASGSLLAGFNPSTPPSSTDFAFVSSTNGSDDEALSAYCPGLLNEEDFEDMDISRICLSYPALKWPAVNKEIMDHSYDPDLPLRTCFRSSNKVCRGYLTPKGGNIAATPPNPADTLPDDSYWTSWPRPSKTTSPNNSVNGYCTAAYGVENYIQLEQNIGNFLTFTRHPGFFVDASYSIKNQQQFCSSFTDLKVPTINATLYGSCGSSQAYTISVDQLNDTTLNAKVADFTNAHSTCAPTADQITAFKLGAYGIAAGSFSPPLDISTYTVALNNAQNSYNTDIVVSAFYNANANLTCTNSSAPNCTVTDGYSSSFNCPRLTRTPNSTLNLGCTMNYQDTRQIAQAFTFDPATFTQSQLDSAVATFTDLLDGSITTYKNYTIRYAASNTEYCPAICQQIGVDSCYYIADTDSATKSYSCPFDYRTSAASAIQAFRNEVNNQMTQKKNAITSAQASYLSGVQNVVQTAVATINTKCNLYYAAYSAGVTSISQDEMCNRVMAANPSITLAQCQSVPMTKKPICQKLINDGGMPQAICNAITNTSLKAACQATVSYTQATCNAISEPSNPYFVLGDALKAGINISTGVISKLNQYVTTTQNITLADGSIITGSHANIAALLPAASPYADYLAQRMITSNNVTLDGVTINLRPQQKTPTRTCDYTQNHRGCYPGACQNTCVKIAGCPAITKVSDFTGYATWDAAPSGTADVVVQGTCQIPQDVGVTTPRPKLSRTCKAVNYSGGVYRYWDDINPNDPGTKECLEASVNYW